MPKKINLIFVHAFIYLKLGFSGIQILSTSRNNPIQPIFKLPKGGRKLVECLPIISKKIGKFGIAELVQLGCHLSKIQHITFGKKISG